MPHILEDLSGVTVKPAHEANIEHVFPDGPPSLPTSFMQRVYSPDLQSLHVVTSFGLATLIEPPPANAFFRPTMVHHAFEYRCPRCFGQLSWDSPPSCKSCSHSAPAHLDTPHWLSPGGRGLTVAYAEGLEDRGYARTGWAARLSSLFATWAFTDDLIEWVQDSYPEPLVAHAVTWELEDLLESAWQGWRQCRRVRIPEKRLARFRVLERTLSSEEQDWNSHRTPTGSHYRKKLK